MMCDSGTWYAGMLLVMLGGASALMWKSRFGLALGFALLVPGFLIMQEATAEAVVQGEICTEMNANQWPCWVINLLACSCTWPDVDGGGGGSGAGLLPYGVMAPPPPPPGWGQHPAMD